MEHEFTNLFSNWMEQKLIPMQDVETMKEAYMGILDAVIVDIVYVNDPERTEKENYSFMANFLERNYAKSFELEV